MPPRCAIGMGSRAILDFPNMAQLLLRENVWDQATSVEPNDSI